MLAHAPSEVMSVRYADAITDDGIILMIDIAVAPALQPVEDYAANDVIDWDEFLTLLRKYYVDRDGDGVADGPLCMSFPIYLPLILFEAILGSMLQVHGQENLRHFDLEMMGSLAGSYAYEEATRIFSEIASLLNYNDMMGTLVQPSYVSARGYWYSYVHAAPPQTTPRQTRWAIWWNSTSALGTDGRGSTT